MPSSAIRVGISFDTFEHLYVLFNLCFFIATSFALFSTRLQLQMVIVFVLIPNEKRKQRRKSAINRRRKNSWMKLKMFNSTTVLSLRHAGLNNVGCEILFIQYYFFIINGSRFTLHQMCVRSDNFQREDSFLFENSHILDAAAVCCSVQSFWLHMFSHFGFSVCRVSYPGDEGKAKGDNNKIVLANKHNI